GSPVPRLESSSLIATGRWRRRSWARSTRPRPPRPTSPLTSYIDGFTSGNGAVTPETPEAPGPEDGEKGSLPVTGGPAGEGSTPGASWLTSVEAASARAGSASTGGLDTGPRSATRSASVLSSGIFAGEPPSRSFPEGGEAVRGFFAGCSGASGA